MDDNQHLKEEILARLEQQNQESSKNIFNADQDRESKVLLDTKLVARESEMKAWSLKMMEEQNENLSKIIDSKIKESSGQANSAKPALASAGKTASGENLKDEVLQLFEDDKRLRNIRF